MMGLRQWLIGVLFSCFVTLYAGPSFADQVTLRFDTFDETEPDEVCVVVDYASLSSGEESIEEQTRQTPTTCSGPSEKLKDALARGELVDTDKAHKAPDATVSPAPTKAGGPKPLERPRMFCQHNGNGSKTRALLLVYNAVLTGLNYGNGVLTLQLNPDKGSSAPTRLELVGREYRSQTTLPLRLRDGSQVVNIPLIPRCVERKLVLPDNVCSESQEPSSKSPTGPMEWYGEGFVQDPQVAPNTNSAAKHPGNALPKGREQTLRIDNSGGRSEVSVSRCGHTFKARWSGPVPPKRLELESETFTFRWRPNCLSPRNTCPAVALPGANVSCHDPDGKTKNGVCSYTCTGSTRFPVQVQLSFADESGTRSRIWSESLDTPGQLLLGYIPESQRSVLLNWNWPSAVEPQDCKDKANDEERRDCLQQYDANQPHECLKKYRDTKPTSAALAQRRQCVQEYNRLHREDRVYGVAGDRIDYTELRTPEGTVHRVHYAANQLRIPELDCQDFISYRYVGTRAFRERVTSVDADGSVKLDAPEELRIDDFALGASLGGGARIIRGAGPVALGPQAEMSVVAVWRHLRRYVEALDVEARAAAIIGTQPYCSRLVDAAGGASCTDDGWERLPYWRFPLVVGINWQIPKTLATDSPPLTFGLHTGVAFTSYFFSKDASKLRRPPLWSSRFQFGYRASRSVSFESYIWAMVGEQPVETVFDDAGVRRHGAISGVSTTSFIPGALIRIDDVF